jgi:apolipoprotein N-acyltransferase
VAAVSDFAFKAAAVRVDANPADPMDPAPSGAGTPSPRRLPAPVAYPLATGSGIALWTSFPSLGWWPAAPVALAGIALATRGQRPRRAFALGLAAGLAFLVPHLHWSGAYVGLLPWSALATFEALFVAAMCALFPAAWRAPGGRAGTVVALTGLWVAQEAVRGRVPFGGFPWARVAFSQAQAPTLGYAALGGAPLLTAAVAAVGACLAVAVVELTARQAAGGRAAAGARRIAVALAVAAAVLFGGLAAPRVPGRVPGDASGSVQVAAVQGNVPEPGLEFNAERRAVLDNHAGATEQLAADVAAGRTPRPDVVVWPENSSDIDPLRNRDAYAVISRAADAVKVPVLIGAVLRQPAPNVSNAAILWGPTGSSEPGPGQWYVKRHPAPFAEYIPYRSFFRVFSDKVDLVVTDFAPGRHVGVLSAGPARLGTVICFEVAYDGLVRDAVRAGADLLVVQTNNATFGFTDESVQQLAMSRVRAVESGRAVVHVSTVGVSALITPDGHEVARSKHFTQQVLQARLPLRTERTVATRLGAGPEWAAAAAGVLLAGLGTRAGREGRAGHAWRGLAGRRRATTNLDGHPRDEGRGGEQEQQL